MLNLYKKEFAYYLNNAIGYIVIVLFAVFANFLFVKDIFVVGSASMKSFFGLLPWLFLIFIPALSMRIFSEEKRSNTIEVLLSLPISETQIVLAKFLALLTLSSISLFLTLSLPVSLAFVSKLYLPEILVGYLGAVLLAGAFISLSLFFSAQTKNQIIAFLMSTIVIFLITLLSTEFFGNILPKTIQDFLVYFSPIYHMENFIKGIIDLRSLFYFLSLISVFLFLSIFTLEKRN